MLDAIKKLFGGKKDKKEESRGRAGAQHDGPTKLAISKEDLSGSASASHGSSGSAASHKAQKGRHHRKHDAMESRSASRGVGGRESSTKAAYAGSVVTGLKFVPDRDTSIDLARSHQDVLPLAGAVGRSASDLSVAGKSGFVDPDGNRLTDDDVKMMKQMLTQVLESYIAHIETIYSVEGLELEKGLMQKPAYNDFMTKFNEGAQVSDSEKEYYLGFEERVKMALIDEKTKLKLLSNVQKKIAGLSGEIDAIQKGAKARDASKFLEEYMVNPLEVDDGKTGRYKSLLNKVVNVSSVFNFKKTLNTVSADFEAHKDEELEGIGDIKEYSAKKSKKLAGGRLLGSLTLAGELSTLYNNNPKFRDAINQDKVIKAANGNKEFTNFDELEALMNSNVVVANRVVAIIEKKKLSKSAKSLENFSKASNIASAYAQTLKSKSTITFSDLMNAYLAINIGVGEKGASEDGKLKAKTAGTGKTLEGPSGDSISADLFLLFNYVAKTMNEMKTIQKTQPNIAKSRAIRLAGIVNTMTVSLHTFANGNGRTCRLLADTILEAFGLPPASVNDTLTHVGGKFGDLYVNDEKDGEKAFDRSTRGYLEGVKASNTVLQA